MDVHNHLSLQRLGHQLYQICYFRHLRSGRPTRLHRYIAPPGDVDTHVSTAKQAVYGLNALRSIYHFCKSQRCHFSSSRRVNSVTISAQDAHDDFVANCNEDKFDENVQTHQVSITPSNRPRFSSKSRFSQGDISEGDMYSAKPVWQQLNELETKWNMHFRRKGRIESQRAISKAKKCIESLDAIESNQSRLVDLDTFREINSPQTQLHDDGNQHHPDHVDPGALGCDSQLSSHRNIPASLGDGHKNTMVHIAKSGKEGSRWMDKTTEHMPTGDFLVNDLHLQGDAYYEQVSLEGDRKCDTQISTEELQISPDEASMRDSISPSALMGRLLNDSERAVLQTILSSQPAGVIDAASPAAVIAAETRLEPETWLNMNPAHIVLQQAILKCRSSSQILLAIQDKIDQLNAVNASTALHRLARHTTSYSRYTLTAHETFGQLLMALERHLPDLDSQGLTNVLWSLVRLRVQPRWMEALLASIHQHAKDLTPSELASCLYAISKLTTKSATSVDLRDSLIGLAQERVSHFKRPLDITCIATALARLNVRNPVLFGQLSSAILASIQEFSLQQLCGVAWAYASLGFTDRALFARIRRVIEENASGTSMRDIVHLSWALSKLREADSELFLCTISPLVRSHISHLSCRDISTVAWAFVNAEIEDVDLFEDLAAALQHHVDDMSTHDIAAAVAAFSHLEDTHKPLFKKMRNRAQLLINEFTPLQLAKIARGFASVADDRFYSQLCRAIESKVHLMLPENVVEVLMGLTEAGKVPPNLLRKLLETVSSGAHKMYAEDCLLLLQMCVQLRTNVEDRAITTTLDRLSTALIEQIEKRVGRWRCYNLEHITLFFECLGSMAIGGSRGDSSVKVLSRHITACLNRLRTSKVSVADRNTVFAAFIRAASGLPPRKLALFTSELSKNAEFMTAMHHSVASLRSGDFLQQSGMTVVDAAYCLVKMGYLDDTVVSLCDDIVTLYPAEDGVHHIDQLSKAIWLLTETNMHLSWVRTKLSMCTVLPDPSDPSGFQDSNESSSRRSTETTPKQVTDTTTPRRSTTTTTPLRSTDPTHHLIPLMWSCVVLGEDKLLMEMVHRYIPLFDRLPQDMLSAQQIALHVLKCLPVIVDDSNASPGHNDVSVPPAGDQLNAHYGISPSIHTTLSEWLDYQRDDLYTTTPGSRKKRALELDYDSILSECLVAMKIPHKTVHTVSNIYRVSVAFPLENHLVDVLNFSDCFVPHGQIRSRALLRQRQLKLLGYGVASIQLGRIYSASRDGSTKQMIAETISGFCEGALDYLPPPT
ncbi:kynurenine 3-monooxygenase and-related flavo monooxygenase family protein, putative [Babesia ovis]|uniref:Kynurenine 3-monooxygenase and-related flavo monooxygenase family protein, putative n=1 Tax=Babesia ovis TaxID=5869 RepID=A0A9W5T952_BABOV|nr:kynurenine 3-monooxygenase and-related flavo monooxygenase family protein, putative [Babesia ovis]